LFLIGAVIMTRPRRIEVPMCERHRWHWVWRFLVLVGGLGAMAILVLAATTLGDGFAVALAFILAYLSIGFAFLVQVSGIRAVRFSRGAIRLKGVARPFADAYEEDRKQREQAIAQVDQERWVPRHSEGS